MKVVCIVQARLGSMRFPCKVLASLQSRPMVSHVLERAQAIHGVDQVVLAVPTGDFKLLNHLWPHVFAGDERDVLGRYYQCAGCYQADVIVRVTGDCPLLAPDLASRALFTFIDNGLDRTGGYLALCQPYVNVADGWDVEIFAQSTLELAHRNANTQQREHVVTWMREHMAVQQIPYADDHRALKCSIDMREDLARAEAVLTHLPADDPHAWDHGATWKAWERAGRP